MARLRDSRNHQVRRADAFRARYDAIVAYLSDYALSTLPADVRPTAMQRRIARATHRKRTAPVHP